jgi:hypothetical protein
MNQELSIEEGIQIQNEHLQEWKIILKENVYEELVKWATSTNGEAKTGYDIRRGSKLDNWIGNYSRFK